MGKATQGNAPGRNELSLDPIIHRNWKRNLTENNFDQPEQSKILTLDVRNPADSMVDFKQAWKRGIPMESARVSFSSQDPLWWVLTAKRWELLKVLCGTGPVSIREAARRSGRDVKAGHGDVTALLNVGILDRTDTGRIVLPYIVVKIEFELHAHRVLGRAWKYWM